MPQKACASSGRSTTRSMASPSRPLRGIGGRRRGHEQCQADEDKWAQECRHPEGAVPGLRPLLGRVTRAQHGDGPPFAQPAMTTCRTSSARASAVPGARPFHRHRGVDPHVTVPGCRLKKAVGHHRPHAHEGHRHHRHPGVQGEGEAAPLEAVDVRVAAAGPLGEHHHADSQANAVGRRRQAAAGTEGVGAVDRDVAGRPHCLAENGTKRSERLWMMRKSTGRCPKTMGMSTALTWLAA